MQERINTASFKMQTSIEPTQYQDIKIYDAYEITAVDGTTITLSYNYNTNDATEMFRIGGILDIDISESAQMQKTITGVEDSGGFTKLTVTPAGADGTVTNYAGMKRFAGNLMDIRDRNITTLSNLEYDITCTDYTKIFDKESVNDTYEDRTARYIINSFLNNFVNYNDLIDQMDYDLDADILAEWVPLASASNPTTDSAKPFEGGHWGVFPTTTAATQAWRASPVSSDVSDFTGVDSGLPTKGKLGFWLKCDDVSSLEYFKVFLGSDASNYIETDTVTIPAKLNVDDEEVYIEVDLVDDVAVMVGTPDWTNFAMIQIQTKSSSGTIYPKAAGFRFMEDEHFTHYPYVEEASPAVTFDDFRSPRLKPTEVMQRLADQLGWYWYVDYERNIHFFPSSSNPAPMVLNATSKNFKNLRITYDSSRLTNRQVVRGGEETSETRYPQVVEGDLVKREWNTKNKFSGMQCLEDKNTSNAPAEAGTTTTNIKITGHALVTGDYITNRTRSNAVRKITYVDVDNFTVDAVASQTTGDTISYFVDKTVGLDGINTADEASFNYMQNPNAQSVRASSASATLATGEFLLMRYFEKFPIIVQRNNPVSIANMKGIIGHTNGIFDGVPHEDHKIKARSEAIAFADAKLDKHSNMVITAMFNTYKNGLRTGQLIDIEDTTSSTRNLDQTFVIQKVTLTEREQGENKYSIVASTLLFGIIELLQQLLKQGRKLEVDDNAIIYNIVSPAETLRITDAIKTAVNDNLQEETLEISDSIVTSVTEPPYYWGPWATNEMTWDFFEWA
jgi:hypothetical protein